VINVKHISIQPSYYKTRECTLKIRWTCYNLTQQVFKSLVVCMCVLWSLRQSRCAWDYKAPHVLEEKVILTFKRIRMTYSLVPQWFLLLLKLSLCNTLQDFKFLSFISSYPTCNSYHYYALYDNVPALLYNQVRFTVQLIITHTTYNMLYILQYWLCCIHERTLEDSPWLLRFLLKRCDSSGTWLILLLQMLILQIICRCAW